MNKSESYQQRIWREFCKRKIGVAALIITILFCLIGIYAPFLASSKPFVVVYDGNTYFPMFRYLLFNGFYTKRLDIFFNLMIFTFPLLLIALALTRQHPAIRKIALIAVGCIQLFVFIYVAYFPTKDPAADTTLNEQQHAAFQLDPAEQWNWNSHLQYMSPYAKLNLLLRYKQMQEQHKTLEQYYPAYLAAGYQEPLPSLLQLSVDHEKSTLEGLTATMKQAAPDSVTYKTAQAKIHYIEQRQQWTEQESKKLKWQIMPLLSHFHWEDDAGGQAAFNHFLPWWRATRINGKSLLPALIFGVRISIVVGMASVGIALLVGIPIGALAGFYGGKFDIVVSRLLEIWESMPAFFMLLMVVAILQSKSIFLVIGAIGLFGWTTFSRYVRGEFFKQRNLPYVEAGRAQGFRNSYIIFKHILPNAIPPVLALLPFAIMGAITSEAGLSFLGLGEEGSCSWGVLMDEGRTAFPENSFLLWPPAALLTLLLIAIALVGDDLRDALDPKLQK